MKFSFSARVAIVLGLLSFGNCVSADPPIVISEPAAGFSYTIPSAWYVQTRPDGLTAIAFADPDGDLRPNIVETDRSNKLSLVDWTKGNLEVMQRELPMFKVLSRSEFATNANAKGVRIAVTATLEGHDLRDIYYFLPGKGGRKYLFTFSALAASHDKYDSSVDAALRTFKLL